MDGLAGGLDTFTTSPRDYGQYLRELSMDTLSAGSKGEHAYDAYLYNTSCGKFLNTLLYLTLKRAKSLEAFQYVMSANHSFFMSLTSHRWNIRVELSRPVFQELHKMKRLKTLQIRLQAGQTYYYPPPPLPGMPSRSPPRYADDAEGNSHIYNGSPTASNYVTSFDSLPPLPPPLRPQKTGRNGSITWPPTLGGFKDLKTLSVLDIDTLDLIYELKTCVKNSPSLSSLKLSFSDDLASQARRPTSPDPNDDSEVEDEFQPLPVSPHSSLDDSGPMKAFQAQQERKAQEAALAKIFDIEHLVAKPSNMRQLSSELPMDRIDVQEEHYQRKAPEGAGELFAASLTEISRRLVTLTRGSTAAHQDVLDTIEKAAKKYVESLEGRQDEQPEDERFAQDENQGEKAANGLRSVRHRDSSTIEKDDWSDNTHQSDAESSSANKTASRKERKDSFAYSENPRCEATQTQYLRATRGLPLESFSVFFIPLKASVLHRAVNLDCLKQLTLLNVGNQVPIWTMLAKVNRNHPLALRSVFTDHVSLAFLQCMAQLDELHELFMLERPTKNRRESFQNPTSTTINQIRRLVLKKHIGVLKRLMIKDTSNIADWDIDEKAMILICTRGVALEELALGMNIYAVVSGICFIGIADSRLIIIACIYAVLFRSCQPTGYQYSAFQE